MKVELPELVYVLCPLVRTVTNAQTDDIAHTDAAFNSDPNPQSAANDIEKEVSCPPFFYHGSQLTESPEKITLRTHLPTLPIQSHRERKDRPTNPSTLPSLRLASSN